MEAALLLLAFVPFILGFMTWQGAAGLVLVWAVGVAARRFVNAKGGPEALVKERDALKKRVHELEVQVVQLHSHIDGMDTSKRERDAMERGRAEILRLYGDDPARFKQAWFDFDRAEKAKERKAEQERAKAKPKASAAGRGKPWWEVLGVSRSASARDIKKAYWALAARYHPDNRNTGDTARMAEINEAKEMSGAF